MQPTRVGFPDAVPEAIAAEPSRLMRILPARKTKESPAAIVD